MTSFLFVPTILFLTIVAPIWIIMHYQSKKQSGQNLNEDDRQALDELLETIDKMADRIDALEEILDEGHPKWRQHKARSDENKVKDFKRTGEK